MFFAIVFYGEGYEEGVEIWILFFGVGRMIGR